MAATTIRITRELAEKLISNLDPLLLKMHVDTGAIELAKAIIEADRAAEVNVESVYGERNQVLAAFARLCLETGYEVGLAKHMNKEGAHDPAWPKEWETVLFIDLLSSLGREQVSWHIHERELAHFHSLPAYPRKWDGHSNAEKYERLARFLLPEKA